MFCFADAEQSFALDVATKPDAARRPAEERRDLARQRALASPRQSADRDESRRLRFEEFLGKPEISPRLRHGARARALIQKTKPGADHLCPDRGTNAQENRQRRQTRKLRLIGRPKISIKDQVGCPPQPTLLEIHQEKREIIKNVSGRNRVVELNRVE